MSKRKRTPRDAMVANLHQRLQAALAEADRQRQRADDAELNLDMACEELQFLHAMMPAQVKWNAWVGRH